MHTFAILHVVMPKRKKGFKHQTRQSTITWFIVALAMTVALAPHAAICRWMLHGWDPYFLSFVRSALAAVIAFPIVIAYRKNLRGRGLVYGLFASVMMSIAVLSFVVSLSLQDASLVGLITLFTPLILIYYSAKVNKERVSHQAKIGVTIAVVGAIIMLGNGFMSGNHGAAFNLVAVLLGFVNCLTYPLATVYYKKANDQWVHLIGLIALGLLVSAAMNLVLWLLNGAHVTYQLSAPMIGALMYIVVVVAVLGKFLNVRSYEHVGSGVMGSLYYLQSTLAVLIPVIVLHEKIRPAILLGGAVILLGIWVAQYHRLAHTNHHQIFHTM